ncbi:MAG: hypothetical protein KatS3mg103_0328 [Phycisphaerales bacterium]|nr:MAG: hypothetical protein KatS3mg103_0328 [Phycisphaerales bacterium]
MLPTFLIIGAQKSGTTTLYRDLLTQPGVFFPYHKEPTNLADDRVLTPKGLAEYEALYASARPQDARGDASTGYTRLPRFADVPRRALRVLGPDVPLIYVVREPVSRIVSHHHHVRTNTPVPETLEGFIQADPSTITFSRYAFQLRAWLEHFDKSRLHVLIFEEYVKDRQGTIERLGQILGYQPQPQRVDPDARFNTAQDRSADRGWTYWLRTSRLYNRIRPHIPAATRDRLRRALTPKAPPPPPPPSAQCVQALLAELEDDHRQLAELLGRPYPIWDPDAVREKYARLRAQHGQGPAPDPAKGPVRPPAARRSA